MHSKRKPLVNYLHLAGSSYRLHPPPHLLHGLIAAAAAAESVAADVEVVVL